MKKLFFYLMCMALIMPATKSVHAQNGGNIVVPCAVPFYRELDFIVGDWQVFHNSTVS